MSKLIESAAMDLAGASATKDIRCPERILRIHFNAFIPSTLHSWWMSDLLKNAMNRAPGQDFTLKVPSCEPPWFWGPTPLWDHIRDWSIGRDPFLNFGDDILPPIGTQYRSDDRDFFVDGTSRIHLEAELYEAFGDFFRADTLDKKHKFGVTEIRRVDFLTGNIIETRSKVTTGPLSVKAHYADSMADLFFYASAANPFFFAIPRFINLSPNIDIDVGISITIDNGRFVSVKFSGHHNAFPGYECFLEVRSCADGRILSVFRLYKYDPKEHMQKTPGVINLSSPVYLNNEPLVKICIP